MWFRHALLARQLIFTVSAGFALALTLIIALALLGLQQLAQNNARLETIDQENNVKTRLAGQMRDILRDRAISMLSIVVTSDPFDKDAEMMRFYAYGSAYQAVRLELDGRIRSPEEKAVLARIDSLTRSNRPVMLRIVNLGVEGYTFMAFAALQQEGLPLQRQLVTQLDQLIQMQRELARQAVQTARTEYVHTRDLMILLGLLAVIVAGLVAWAVVRRTARLAALSERQRTKFRTLFETNTDGIVILDEHGFTDCNPATLAMFHMARTEDFLARRPEQLGVEIQASGEAPKILAEKHIRAAMDNGHAFFEWVAQRPDGSRFAAEIALHAMTLDGRRVIQAIMRDVSPQKEAEAALKAARDAALSAAEMKSQFVANVSHEIRTPMNGILGMTQLLLGSPLNARQKEYAAAITRSAEALMSMLNDLLDFSKIEAGQLSLERIDFNLHDLLMDIIELYQPRAQSKGLALRLTQQEGLSAWVHGDPLRIRQILLNLTDNAIKFTHQGEVRLSVEAVPDVPDRLRLTLSDTGIGMEPAVQTHVFHAFAQGDGSISRRYGGTGLGLTICKQLAELMGGALTLSSMPGQGSAFTLELPLPATTPAESAAESPTGQVHFPGSRVLVAEDNSVNQKLVQFMLENLDIEVCLADDGKAAFDLLAHEHVDLVLMDCQMPEWDGLTATRAIRAREAAQGLPRLPILALTANAMSGYAETCHQAGMDDYLAKPLREDDLADALKRWLSHHAVAVAEPAAEAVAEAPAGELDMVRLRRVCRDDPAQLGEMLRLFINSTETQLDAIGQALSRSDATGMARLAHQIKGAAGYLGATTMMQLATEVEAVAKDADLAACTTLHEDLEAQFIALRLEIEAHLGGYNSLTN